MSKKQPTKTGKSKDVIADHLQELKKIQLNGYERGVKRARNALIIAAIALAVIQVWVMYNQDVYDDFAIMITVLISGAFLLCAFWTKTKPYSALIAGITVYIFYLLINLISNAMIDGADGIAKTLVTGIIYKAAMLIILIRPLKEAKELQEAKEQE